MSAVYAKYIGIRKIETQTCFFLCKTFRYINKRPEKQDRNPEFIILPKSLWSSLNSHLFWMTLFKSYENMDDCWIKDES